MHQCIKFILFWNNSRCFRRSFRPSSGVHDCTYSNRHLSDSYCCLLASKQTAVAVWQMPVAVCTVVNSWWWTERPSETCRVSFQNKIHLRHWCIWLVLLQKDLYTLLTRPVFLFPCSKNPHSSSWYLCFWPVNKNCQHRPDWVLLLRSNIVYLWPFQWRRLSCLDSTVSIVLTTVDAEVTPPGMLCAVQWQISSILMFILHALP